MLALFVFECAVQENTHTHSSCKCNAGVDVNAVWGAAVVDDDDNDDDGGGGGTLPPELMSIKHSYYCKHRAVRGHTCACFFFRRVCVQSHAGGPTYRDGVDR